ncbi:MAG: DUF2130 domain-containing protein [Acidobacteria bacterium]|nr:DUF2130 domain-containing protein [Acidobacteriota bacterium]
MWKTREEHIHRLEVERKEIEEERKKQAAKTQRLEKEYHQKLAGERRKIRQTLLEQERRFKAQIKQSRAEWEKASQKIVADRIQQGVVAGIAREKRALKNREDVLRKEQNKRERVEKLLDATIGKNEQSQLEVKQLREQLARKSTPQIDGLLEEGALLESLKKIFPDDRFAHPGKGGDIIQSVLEQGQVIGVIVYECKRVRTWNKGHIEQTCRARRQRKADYAVLVTNAFPSKKQYYFVENNVFVISPISIEPLVILLRESLVRMASLRLSYDDKAKSVKLVYDYLSGNEYANKIREIAGRLAEAQSGLQSEIEAHQRTWHRREDCYRHLVSDVLSIDGSLKKLIQGGEATGRKLRSAEMRNGLDRIHQA